MTSVKVAVRVRPLNKRELDLGCSFIIQMHDKKTTIVNNKLHESSLDGVSETTREAMRVKDFTFDFSFWTVDSADKERYHDQEMVYKSLGVDVVDSGYEGYNACVFAYGQTGSGKTYTMMGPPDDPGLIPRICQELFNRMTDETTSYRAEVSYLEIYNEKVRDLLKTTDGGTHNLRVREHPKEGPYVQGLSKYVVGSFTEMLSLMQRGNSVRTTASTNMNDVSSRSHAIFTIVFTQATIKDGIPSEKTSKIHLVDLAGSERATATGATGVRLREGGSINKSLVSLGTVIKQLAEVSEKGHKPGKGSFIPYRDSVLTWLLKDSLGGNSRTIMVTTISPADVNYAETLSALRYANRAKNIINRPTVNEDQNVKIIRELKEEIERLKMLVGGDIDNISKPRMKEKLHESEARMKVLTEEWSEKWKDIAAILREQGTLALRKEGRGVVLDSALPHLIGIDDDILSTGIKFFHLKEGITRIGSVDADPPVDIVIAGQEVEVDHCTIEFQGTIVTLIPSKDALCCVNGNQVTEPTKLTQGAVVLLGKTNMFRYNNPAEAAQMKKELEKTGLSFKRTSLISQSMTDLYRSSENLSGMNGCTSSFDLDVSHREENEKLDELRTQIKELENRYHAEEEERINHQVAMEMELEKKQKMLDRAYQELNKVQQEVLQVHQSDRVLTKLPKGSEIDEMLKKLNEQEQQIQEASRITRDTLMEKLETVRTESDLCKARMQDRVAALDERERHKDNEIKLLQDELTVKQQTANDQDEEDQKVIDIEQQQLEKLCKECDIMFHSKLRENETLQKKWQKIEKLSLDVREKFDTTESAMREKWKVDLDEIGAENKEIEEAWNDLKDQEKEYDECLKSGRLSADEISEIEAEMAQLHVAKGLLKLEENKVAAKERTVLDAVELEMEKFEEKKKAEEAKVETLRKDLVRECGSSDLNQLSAKVEEKQRNIEGLVSELQKQSRKIKDLEKAIEQKKRDLISEKAEIAKEKEEINNNMCQTVIKLDKDIIAINEDLEGVDAKMNEELALIQEERQGLLLLKKSQNISAIEEIIDDEVNIEKKLQALKLSEDEQKKLDQKRKDLEALQAAVDKANEELDEKVRHYDQARDFELDVIELEKESLNERIRQDRINILVEQEVKRRMFEEKIHRENKHQLERDLEKKDREEEIKRLKEAHNRELKDLKARYEKRTSSMSSIQTPTQSNPYADTLSPDGEDSPRRRSQTGYLARISETVFAVHITIPMFRLQCYGSDSHYEFEVKIVVGEDVWSVMRRYSQFREFHHKLKTRIPEVGALVFPPKKFFSKNDKVAAERKIQLEFYLRSAVEICLRTPSCYLHPSHTQFLSKQVLCDFDPFFRKGLFEPSKEWWKFQEVGQI